MKKKKILSKLFKYWPLYIMFIPGMVYLIINNYMPMFGVLFAFKKIDYSVGFLESPWVGLQNFKFLFTTKDAFLMFRNTLGYNFVFIVLGNVLAFAVAIAIDTIKNKYFKNFVQMIILIPYLLSIVIVSYLVYAFLNPTNGFMNNTILKILGLDEVSWYTTPGPWPYILTIVHLWMTFGYQSVMYYSTLIGIDRTYYEAAVIDGAGIWHQITKVTIPCMRHTIIILLILAIGRICYSDFGLFYQIPMHSGLLNETTQTIDTFVFKALLEQNSIGRSAAAGFLQAALGFILVMATNGIVNKLDKESALF